MDNYKLEEVKNIIDKNLLTPDVLKNVLKSATRRIEIYGDESAIEILKYLSTNNVIPSETKEEINKYLAQCDNYNIENKIKDKEETRNKKINIIIISLSAIVISLILIIILTKK